MERFKGENEVEKSMIYLYLHSNMERFKDKQYINKSGCLLNLHSNMERFKVINPNKNNHSSLRFTFQYGEI